MGRAVPLVHPESVRTIYKEQFGEFFSLRNMSMDSIGYYGKLYIYCNGMLAPAYPRK